MLRTALKPPWLALLALVLAAATGMAWLGHWQLSRAREASAAAELARLNAPPVPIGEVLTAREPFPGSAVDRPVTAAGQWDQRRSLLVVDRPLAGQPGSWLLTPLVLADGSAVPVVRGWVAGAAAPSGLDLDVDGAPAADGEVPARVSGVLRPAEPPSPREPGARSELPAGQLDRVDVTELIKRWPYPLLTGYVVAADQAPDAPAGVRPVSIEPDGGGWALRNLSYAVQWWLFAVFGMFLWWRLVRDAHRGRLAHPDGAAVSSISDDGGRVEPHPQPANAPGADP